MQIESIIRRPGGTKVLLGTTTYVFTSTATDPRQIVEVTNPTDIQKLLAIKEGYRIADPQRATPSDARAQADTDAASVLSAAAATLKSSAAVTTAATSTKTTAPAKAK